MNVRRLAVVLTSALALGGPGCSRTDAPDPATSRLLPGTLAVVSTSPGDAKEVGPDAGTVAIYTGERMGFQVNKRLPPGVMVRIGTDPGYADRTAEEIAEERKAFPPGESSREVPAEKPARYHPPHWRSGWRRVRVVVESGEHAGLAGEIDRRYLRSVEK